MDYLKKRLIGSKSAATITNNESDDVVFPDWTGVDTVSSERIDWTLVAKIHIGILEAIHLWISEFFVDFYCDQSLTEYFLSFLSIAAREFSLWDDKQKESEQLSGLADEIEKLWTDLKKLFSKQMFTPFTHVQQPPTKPSQDLQLPSSSSIPELESLVETIESTVARHFKAVRLVDWMLTFEILETQSAEPLGFFVPKLSLLSSDDDMVIQDIFSLISNLRRSNSNISIFESLPRPVQELCVLHQRIGDWAVAHIADPSIGLEARGRKIAALLKCLTICRSRMSSLDLYEGSSTGQRQYIPSFVESTLSAALVRPESRVFSLAWALAAEETVGAASQVLLDTLEPVVPKVIEGLTIASSMTPCLGWLLERMLEIICYVPNMLVENNRLINFDKRRYIYNLINNFTNAGKMENPSVEDLTRIEEPCFSANFEADRRQLREVSMRENQTHRNGRIKVFWKLHMMEQEKLRRDAKQREVIDRREKDQVRALHRRQPTLPTEAPKKSGKRLGVNTLFKAVRPISMALTNSWTPPTTNGRSTSPYDLPSCKGLVHSRKPTASIDLTTLTHFSCSKSFREQFTWRIQADGGTRYFLQAISETELEDWLRLIAGIRGMSATDGAESIDGETLLSQRSAAGKYFQINSYNMKRIDVVKVFGVSLADLCRRDHVKVPLVVEALLGEIEHRGWFSLMAFPFFRSSSLLGLNEVGIYRVPGSTSSINALKSALDSGDDVRMDDDRWYDINAIAGCFKLFMRELPGSLIPLEILGHLKTLTCEYTLSSYFLIT